MEQLINQIITMGGHKSRLEVKAFGGGNVIKSQTLIGSSNAQFVHEFLQKEGLRIISEDLGGTHPRRVHYFPTTGKALVRSLRRKNDMHVVSEEAAYAKTLNTTPLEGEIDLF